jgi:hypothetical protein
MEVKGFRGQSAEERDSVTYQETRKRMGFGHENWVKLGSFPVFKDAKNICKSFYINKQYVF